MSLFQTSVLKKYLNDLNQEIVNAKYQEFIHYFGNTEIQQNIYDSKEEEFQEGFIRELFVKIFGYTLKPNSNYNIVLEKKNVDNSKKADGAIIKDNRVIAVIELKSTQTPNLDTVELQAFNYKNHHTHCKYVIISNFEKIRIYIEDATDHIEFDLFHLPKEKFEILWLYFNKENILNDIPLKIKEASVLQEEDVTKKLYADYSTFRTEIYNNIVKNNTEYDKLILFKKTQKLLDRFLFIFFAEDRLLLPPNSISEIVKQWTELKENYDEYFPLYERFKKYFGYLNTGHKGKHHNIFAYNGGLFKPDEVLDNIKIDDEILKEHTIQLSKYNFETDVDVNILGHIFEHSLGEIENIQAEIEGEQVHNQKTKRKKDGIYYTPKYITKYIVDNTIGKLCEEKRKEFGIVDEEYAKGRKNRKKDIVKNLDDKLTQYREWLLQITILDPACGSGAFLNQALEFLINEHTKIDELKAQLLGGSIIFQDVESRILENNLYGVDLNEESVEIAKLSLWLRTAQKGRKLTTLSNHIKCGNSLIDDPEIAGEKAFNWEQEFPEVFAKEGFDVVIGNPPYVSIKEIDNEIKNYLKQKYKTAVGQFDLYGLFIETSYDLLKTKGIFSFITSNTFINNKDFIELRKFLLFNTHIISIVNLGETVFDDANLDVAIIIYQKIKPNKKNETLIIRNRIEFDKNNLSIIKQDRYNFELNNYEFKINASEIDYKILNKIYEDSILLKEILELPRGIEIGGNSDLITQKANKKIIVGRDIGKYQINFNNTYINFNYEDKSTFKDIAIYEQPKILIQRIRNLSLKTRIVATYDEESYLCTNTLRIGILKDVNFQLKYLLAIINSKLINYLFLKFFLNKDIYAYQLEKIPIKKIDEQTQILFSDKSDLMLNLNKKFTEQKNKFLNRIMHNFNAVNTTKKIESFYDYNFKNFVSALKKQKINLTLVQQDEWEEYFNLYKDEINQLQSEINKTDQEIDQMVYELYGLTEEEIKVVERSL